MPEPGQLTLPVRLRAVLDAVPALVAVLRGPDLVVDFANLRHRRLAGMLDVTGRRAAELSAPGLERYLRQLERVLATGETVSGWEAALRLPGVAGESYWDYVMIPLRDAPGEAPAGVVLHATEVTRLVEARRRAAEAEHRFTTLFDANVTGVTVTGETELFEANDAFLAMIGRTREDLAAGLDWTELSSPATRDADLRAMDELRRTGAAAPFEKRYLRPDGSEVPVLISGSRLQSDPLRILATAFDLTERQAVEREVEALLARERDARLAAERAQARTSRLQAFTASVSASSSPGEIARAVVLHVIEDLSASAAVLARGGRDLRLEHALGVPRDVVEQWRDFPATLPEPLRAAARGAEALVEVAGREEVARAAPALAPAASLVAVPLRAAGRTLGALLLAFRAEGGPAAEDRDALDVVVRQAATALDRAELYEDRAYVARTLQRGLLPSHLDALPGLEAAVVYESISGGGEVGGDFYDVFDTGRGTLAVAVGDVSGKGTEAAVVTGLARHTVRAVARMEDGPARVLESLNGALRRHGPAPAFCTVGFAVIESDDSGFAVRLSSGGHPFPLLVGADGSVREVEVTGSLLGAFHDPEFDECALRLGPGDAIVVYTDGVTDAREAGGERFGDARLLAALRGAAGGTAAALARAVEAAVRAHHPGTPADDRAIVVLRAEP